MAEKKLPGWGQLRLGLFFFLGAVILTVSVFVVGTNKQLFTRHYDLTLYLDNAQGLSRGALVTLSGMEVGYVADMRFAQVEGRNAIEFTLSVENEFRRRITRSTTATLRTVGVLGDRFIDLSLGDPEETPLEAGGRIDVAAGTTDWTKTLERSAEALEDFVALLHETQTLLANINQGRGTIGLLAADPRTAENLRELLENLTATSRDIQSGEGTLGRLIADPRAFDSMTAVLDRVDSLTLAMTQGDGLMARLMYDAEMAERVDHVVAISDSLVTAMPKSGTLGKLMSDEAMYHELLESLTQIKALVEDIRANPEKYVRVSVF